MHKSISETDAKELKKIHDIVLKLESSEDSFLDLINNINSAITIAKKYGEERNLNPLLNNLVQTQEKQLESYKAAFKNNVDRDYYFNELKSNFISDLSMFGFGPYFFNQEI